MTDEKRVPTKKDFGGGVHHPAPYGKRLYPIIASMLQPDWRVLDPFAGVGGVHELRKMVPGLKTFGIEIEPEWANVHPDTHVGDATRLRNRDNSFDAVVTSPTFGNRMADHHKASDPEGRRSYTHDLGRTLTKNNSGAMYWGPEYRALHFKAWRECWRVIRPGGRMILNIKDSVKNEEIRLVSMWHVATLSAIAPENDGEPGFIFNATRSVALPGKAMHTGTNKQVRADTEYVLVFDKPEAS